MPTHLASLGSLVHPHQMEVQEFDSYGLVIDARSAEAYQDDHLPGAVSVPVGFPYGATTGARTAGVIAREEGPVLPYALTAQLHRLTAGDTVLVYCDRGGLDSMVWAAPLKASGFRVDVLGGGWINYRRWVAAGLEVLPRALTFRRLVAPPVGGLCRVVERLAKLGEQVLDLTTLAGQRLVPGLTLVGDTPPSQAAFETALLDALRRFNPQRPVWVRDGLSGFGELGLPPSLRDALQRSDSLWLEVPLTIRAQAWAERMEVMGIDVAGLLRAISASTAPPNAAAIEQWRSMADAGQGIDALTEIVKGYIDPLGHVASWTGQGHLFKLASLAADTVAAEVEQWRNSEAWGA